MSEYEVHIIRFNQVMRGFYASSDYKRMTPQEKEEIKAMSSRVNCLLLDHAED